MSFYRVLWILCLLTGSVTCGPVRTGRMSFLQLLIITENSRVSSDKASGFASSQGAVHSAGLGSYGGTNNAAYDGGYVRPQVGGPNNAAYDVRPQVGGPNNAAYDVRPQVGGPNNADGNSYSNSAAPYETWNSGYAASYDAEGAEPVFSDVSDLDPVYSYSSRSRYQRGRAVFAQTRYIPGEPVFPPVSMARYSGKTTEKESGPADAPAKGGLYR
uniref:Uncharacterized protein n=1 Tax=Mola mola TaxID=94237 RepID=A0A3Q3XA90_MOLML